MDIVFLPTIVIPLKKAGFFSCFSKSQQSINKQKRKMNY
jgi:hypothetical protein